MVYGYRTRSNRGGFRSPRGSSGRGGSFGGRGRGSGSDSYYGSGRGSSHRGSGYHGRDNYYDSRSGGNKYTQDRYSNTASHRKVGDYHYRERESASGSYNRDFSRRNDMEPDRKRMKSEIGTYKEGVSPRRSFDNMEHSSRGYVSNSSYYNTAGSFKNQKKNFGEFKRPLPVENQYEDRRPSRGFRGRGRTSRPTVVRERLTTGTMLKRTVAGRITKPSATRLQQLLRKKKNMQIARMRRAREEHARVSISKHKDEKNDTLSDEDFTVKDEVTDQTVEQEKLLSPKNEEKEIKSEPLEEANLTEKSKLKKKEKSPVGNGHRNRIILKCVHCRHEYGTFKFYIKHLTGYVHKQAMEKLVHMLKLKLRRMRTTQRDQQRILDEQCDSHAKTTYCKLCKLNFKQSPAEHYTSQYHVKMDEFLNPWCNVCHIKFPTPIMFEHHRCTVAHIKRKAFVERKQAIKRKEEVDEENNEDFMVLDSVGSADESEGDLEQLTGGTSEVGSTDTKRKPPKMIGNEFIIEVSSHYCELCKVSIKYDPTKSQEELLLIHCRSPYHLKQYNLDKLRKEKKEEMENVKVEEEEVDTNSTNEIGELEIHDEKFWADDDELDDKHKLSEDEEDSQYGNRYDRFRQSDEKEPGDKKSTEEDLNNVVKGNSVEKIE